MRRMMSTNTMMNIGRNLSQVQEKIQAASSKRPQHLQYFQPRLVAVSKTKGVEMIIDAYDCGQRHFGENYINELHEKSNDIELQDHCEDIQWHFIGHLQRNKISKILDVPNLYVIETVDSERLAKTLNEAWARYNKTDRLNIMIQCNTSSEDNKNGCAPSEVMSLVKFVREQCLNLNFMGIMTIGRFDHDLSTGPNPDFQSLITIRDDISKELEIPRENIELSMGMSGDFEHAIEVGSSNVRVGTTIFGARPYPRKDDSRGGDSKEVSNGKAPDIQGSRSGVIKCQEVSQLDSPIDQINGYVQQRLLAVKGHGGKANDVFVCGNIKTCSEHIIFFGGDVQDFPERMMNHRDNKRYVEWNLEATSLNILKKFPDSLVITVKPVEMYLKTFSKYTNFVELSDTGRPIHLEDNGALIHLFELYMSILKELNSSYDENVHPLRIIGFSKGCIVLNQFVFELHLKDKNDVLKRFIDQIRSIHWLDGGHSGGPENTWLTQDEELKRLAQLPCEIFINVTPYQIKDPNRDWIGKQEAKFYKKLKKFNAKVHRIVHFDLEPGSIENHFSVLEEFH